MGNRNLGWCAAAMLVANLGRAHCPLGDYDGDEVCHASLGAPVLNLAVQSMSDLIAKTKGPG
jgi:hypothetical protein